MKEVTIEGSQVLNSWKSQEQMYLPIHNPKFAVSVLYEINPRCPNDIPVC